MAVPTDFSLPAPTALLGPDGRVLVFGGPYGNLEATRAVLAEADRLAIAPERIVCTGDVVAYCADPAETADLVRRAGIRVVMGNCEESLAMGSMECCGFQPGSACDALAVRWFDYASRQLDAEARAWMAGLPPRLHLEIAGCRLCVVHGGAESINRFLFASSPVEDKAAELDAAGCDGIVAGHCGLPFTQQVGGRLWHNPGAIGLPANDGTPRTWFSLLRPRSGGLWIEHRPLEYDSAAAAAKMRRAGLPAGYADALATGMWPSCDVLPAKELGQRGVPLNAGAALWPHARSAPDRGRQARQLVHLWPAAADNRADAIDTVGTASSQLFGSG